MNKSKKPKVAILSKTFAISTSRPVEYLEKNSFQVVYQRNNEPFDETKVAKCIGDANAAIISAQDIIGRIVFDTCSHLKIIAIHGIGCDKIDMKGAKKRGIKIYTCPANYESVADLTWLLILASSRDLLNASASVLKGRWEPGKFSGVEVFEKTIGIVGYGRIGKAVAKRAMGFNNRILIYDPYVNDIDFSDRLNIRKVPFNTLLHESDIITLHLPLVKETEKIVDINAIQKMKDGVLLINTSRGGLIDENALYKALKSGKLHMAGLDVFAQEPPVNNKLLTLPNVIPTPHMGAQTYDANLKTGMMAAEYVVKNLKTLSRDFTD
jgi:D-3-phosphoglycerate dehydrogenase